MYCIFVVFKLEKISRNLNISETDKYTPQDLIQ